MIINRIEKKTNYRFVNLFSAHYTDRNKMKKEWIYASRSDMDNPLDRAPGLPDAVVIVPYHAKKKELVLIKEFRISLNGYQYGFPAGLIDPGETIEQAGKRELYEETGLQVSRVLRKSPLIYSSSGLTDESVCMFYVECDGQPSNEYNEASEDIEVVFLSQDKARHLIDDHTLKFDVKTWIVLQQFVLHGTL